MTEAILAVVTTALGTALGIEIGHLGKEACIRLVNLVRTQLRAVLGEEAPATQALVKAELSGADEDIQALQESLRVVLETNPRLREALGQEVLHQDPRVKIEQSGSNSVAFAENKGIVNIGR